MKTLADLKRDAKNGLISGELIERYGSTEILERLQGVRKIVDANSVGITFLNADGKKSECQIKRASLMEYDTDKLVIYNEGYRDLNEQEKAVMDGWKAITETEEYKERSKTDVLTDGSSTYWQKKSYFEKSGLPYLMGYDESQGKKYDHNTGKVRDASIKGDAILVYRIIRQ